jgi:hypothetical protein
MEVRLRCDNRMGVQVTVCSGSMPPFVMRVTLTVATRLNSRVINYICCVDSRRQKGH